MACADVSPFAGAEKCPDFRGTDTPAAIPLDVSSGLASISEKITVSIRHDVYIYVKESEKNDKREAVCSLCT